MNFGAAMQYWWLDVQIAALDLLFWAFVAFAVCTAIGIIGVTMFGDRDDRR